MCKSQLGLVNHDSDGALHLLPHRQVDAVPKPAENDPKRHGIVFISALRTMLPAVFLKKNVLQ